MNPDTGDFGWREHVADLDRLVRALRRGRKVVLAGSSWGSELALRYAYVHPGSVDAIVLSGFVGWVSESALRGIVEGRDFGLVGPGSTGSRRPSVIHLRPTDRFQPDLGRIDLGVNWSILPRDSTPPDAVPPPPNAFPGRRDLFPVPVAGDSATFESLRQKYIKDALAGRGRDVRRRSGGPGTGLPRTYAMLPQAVAGDSALAWRFPEMCGLAGLRTGISRTSPPLDSLRSVLAPTLALSGGRLPGQGQPDNAHALVGVLPNLVLDTIPGGGHDPWRARTDEFFARVVAFLRPILASVRQ